MDEEKKPTVILHQENHNCNIFQGNIFGGVFPLPGSTVNYCQGGERNENLQASASEDSLSREDRICHCVEQLIDEDVIRKKGDLAAIRQVLLDKGCYGDIQTTKFVQLLKKGCSAKVHDMLPSDSMLRKIIISGKYPEWRITDSQPDETARLVEVARRFLMVFE